MITADSDSKMYDGQPLTNAGYTYTEGVLASGDVLTAVVEGTITDFGTEANKVTSYKVMRGETDVTANYTFGESVDGELKITKRSVTLTSATDSKTYDGQPLTNSTVTVSGDGFIEGEGASYDVTGTITNVGSSDNTFTYILDEGTNSANYDIAYPEYGTLTVEPLDLTVTITEHSSSVTYDGKEHEVTGYDVEIGNDLYTEKDFTFSGDASAKGTNAGTYDMELKPEDFENTNPNFGTVTFEIVDGQLVIDKATMTIKITGSTPASEQYDGKVHTAEGYTASSDSELFDASKVRYNGEARVSETAAGTYPMGLEAGSFSYDDDNFDGVTFEVTDGELVITTRPVTVTADSASKRYDGKELTKNSATADGLADGDQLASVTVTGTQTKQGSSDNVPSDAKIANAAGEDVTSSYEITYVNGTLEVKKASSGGGSVLTDDHINYILGYEDGTFRPQGNITRAETAAILFRLLKESVRNEYMTKDNSFTDVPEETWYSTYVSTLADMGIFTGYEDGSFNPSRPITRAEFATIASRFSPDEIVDGKYDTNFDDVNGHWAQAAIKKAQALGYITGYDTGDFKPNQFITRAEAVVVVNRMLDRSKTHEDSFKSLRNRMFEFDDLMGDEWFYADIMEATNNHNYNKSSDGYEQWTSLNKNIDWTKFQY